MTPEAFREAIDALGLTQQAAGRFLGTTERTVRRWATDPEGPPRAVALLLQLMIRFRLMPDELN
jgi:DNA-binding transcriptional regulator YiaG